MRFALEGRSYDTEKMADLGIVTRYNHGVCIAGVYLTKRSKRVFVCTDSLWQDDNAPGCAIGQRWHQAESGEIGQLADTHDCDFLRELLPDDSD